jgi:hypothetical protein
MTWRTHSACRGALGALTSEDVSGRSLGLTPRRPFWTIIAKPIPCGISSPRTPTGQALLVDNDSRRA